MNKISSKELKKLDINSVNHSGLNSNDEITCLNGTFVKIEDLKQIHKNRRRNKWIKN